MKTFMECLLVVHRMVWSLNCAKFYFKMQIVKIDMIEFLKMILIFNEWNIMLVDVLKSVLIQTIIKNLGSYYRKTFNYRMSLVSPSVELSKHYYSSYWGSNSIFNFLINECIRSWIVIDCSLMLTLPWLLSLKSDLNSIFGTIFWKIMPLQGEKKKHTIS